MALNMPPGSSITGTGRVSAGSDLGGSAYAAPAATNGTLPSNIISGYPAGVTSGTTQMTPAIQVVWSKEILFQSMPVLRFEQFAVKKTELGVMPGLTVNFMRYNNLPIPSGPLVEGIRMKTYGITAQQYRITVAEQGFGVAVSELLLNASFDDIMASASRLLGRNMALYMDVDARHMIQTASSSVQGYIPSLSASGQFGPYNPGAKGTGGNGYMSPAAVKDAVQTLATKNVPRLGDTYVCFVHPSQGRSIRDWPEFIEVTKYAAPGNFMLGEIGRLYDVVFIETTQIDAPLSANTRGWEQYDAVAPAGASTDKVPVAWRKSDGTSAVAADPLQDDTSLGVSATPAHAPGTITSNVASTEPDALATPGWDQTWPNPLPTTFEALMLGDNAFGHAVSLPVELRDGGVLDFGREHALAWYGIWGFGLITDSAVVRIPTLGGVPIGA